MVIWVWSIHYANIIALSNLNAPIGPQNGDKLERELVNNQNSIFVTVVGNETMSVLIGVVVTNIVEKK